jgi:hypothetical protein
MLGSNASSDKRVSRETLASPDVIWWGGISSGTLTLEVGRSHDCVSRETRQRSVLPPRQRSVHRKALQRAPCRPRVNYGPPSEIAPLAKPGVI